MKARFTFVRYTVCCGSIDVDSNATEEEMKEAAMAAIEDGNFDEDDSYDDGLEIEREDEEEE